MGLKRNPEPSAAQFNELSQAAASEQGRRRERLFLRFEECLVAGGQQGGEQVDNVASVAVLSGETEGDLEGQPSDAHLTKKRKEKKEVKVK
jgi:hypothetical protein